MSKQSRPENPIIASFRPVGEAIADKYTPGKSPVLCGLHGLPSLPDLKAQKDVFLYEFIHFVEMTDIEQRVQMSDKLPTVEEYMHRRMGSSAVGICLAMTE